MPAVVGAQDGTLHSVSASICTGETPVPPKVFLHRLESLCYITFGGQCPPYIAQAEACGYLNRLLIARFFCRSFSSARRLF